MITLENIEITMQGSRTGSGPLAFDEGILEQARKRFQEIGAVLIRDTAIETADEFERLMAHFVGEHEFCEYEEDKISPRTRLARNVYTSTDYNKKANIYFHNECCTRVSWPMLIAFFCRTPARSGGITPISDIAAVTEGLPVALKNKFEEKGVGYIRNLGGRFGHSVEYTFGTDERGYVEEYCRTEGIDCHWLAENRVRFFFKRPAFVTHPGTGERLWFNNALFWNRFSLDRTIQLGLNNVSSDELAFHTQFGDGTEIAPDELKAIKASYDRATIAFDWNQGDLLILDNMRFAHARTSYTDDDRKIWVMMAGDYLRARDADIRDREPAASAFEPA